MVNNNINTRIVNLREANGSQFFTINFLVKKINVWNSKSAFRNGNKLGTYNFNDFADVKFITNKLEKKGYSYIYGSSIEAIKERGRW